MDISIMMALTAVFGSPHRQNMQQYLNDTQNMVLLGRYQEALERFIWFHEHALEYEPGMYGVRLSFALRYWKALGDLFPPARAALVAMRDHKEKALEENSGGFELFLDVAALNRILEEEERTVSLFDGIDQVQPKAAKLYWHVAKDAVIAARRYDLVKKYIGNLMYDFAEIKKSYDEDTALYDDEDFSGDDFRFFNENQFVEETLKLINVALALDDRKTAEELQSRARAVLDDERLQKALPPPSADPET